MALEIVKLGFSHEDADILAVSIGDRPCIDAHSGRLFAWFPDGRFVLLPRTVLTGASVEED